MSIILSMLDLAWKHWRSIALIALLVGAALIGRAWYEARKSSAALAATVAASQKQISAAAADEKTRDAELATQLARIAALEKKVQTPAQALAALPGALPPLPLPITFSSTPTPPSSAAPPAGAILSPTHGAGNQPARSASSANSSGAQTAASPESSAASAQSAGTNTEGPTSNRASTATAPMVPSTLGPIVASIPQADLKPLYDYLENCQATTLDRDAARKDLADEQTQVTALTQQRDAAAASAKGGGFWTRFRRGAKWFAIGAATGAVAGAIAAHH